MVHIKRVEIYGFKSFGPRNTVVDFRPGLVSISGANGSGKSNILDAIIFAMGENKPRLMRVPKLRKLLYEKDDDVAGAKMARVSVHFDNSDRRIPVDSDSVEITREMNAQGEHAYYLNRKRTQQGHVQDLMDAADASLDNYNVVQQMRVTEIAESSPEEKRKAIEGLVGLSAFDERKAASEKNLEEADRKLDVAMARMGVIREAVETLEEQRNRKLRHGMVSRELDRLRAIAASGRLRAVAERRDATQAELDSLRGKARDAEAEKAKVEGEIGRLEAEKAGIMDEAQAHERATAGLDRDLAEALKASEAAAAGAASALRQAERQEALLPGIRAELGRLRAESAREGPEAGRAGRELEEAGRAAAEAAAGLESARAELREAAGRHAAMARKKSEAEGELRALGEELAASRLALHAARAGAADAEAKIRSNTETRARYEREFGELLAQKPRLESAVGRRRAAAAELESRLAGLEARRARIDGELQDLGAMLERSSRAGARYGERIRAVRGMMHEEYSAARLKEDAEQLGIMGLAYELVTWDPEHERAMMAVGSDWIKATVVRDFGTLVGLAEYARYKGLPKLKIIPLEAIPRLRPELPAVRGAVGLLSDFARCDRRYDALRSFLFGGVVLADSRESAHRLSRAGYRAVTAAGESFEARSSAAVIDVDSRISRITKIISMSGSVEGLMESISLLKKHVQRKRRLLGRTEAAARECRERLGEARAALARGGGDLEQLGAQAGAKSGMRGRLDARIAELERERGAREAEAERHGSDARSLEGRVAALRAGPQGDGLAEAAAELERLTASRTGLEARHAEAVAARAAAQSRLAGLEAAGKARAEATSRLEEEERRTAAEAAGQRALAASLEEEGRGHEERLVGMREREQELASSSGGPVSRLQECDARLKDLGARERSLSEGLGRLGRREVSLSRDMKELGEDGASIQATLDSYSFEGKVEEFDVGPLLRELEAEQRTLGELNSLAPAQYLEKSGGYRSMSARKNKLEEERTSIVRFIEDIEREKLQTFMEALDKVDKGIRETFASLTGGGSAWLEVEDEDDVFGSGISYMVQLPTKTKRESTSLSGGEKALAGMTFILAMQGYRPSPFYMFDEADAPLDAQNAKRLAGLLAERARDSQFIMVSLKDSVVERAGLIYGVYGRNGASHVLEYKDRRLPSMSDG